MDANTQNISEATIALIDSLKSTTSHFGLANSGSEYKIITEMFLYKYFNDKFGYEAKRDKVYGERLSYVFQIFNTILVPTLCNSHPNKNVNRILKALLICYYFAYWYRYGLRHALL